MDVVIAAIVIAVVTAAAVAIVRSCAQRPRSARRPDADDLLGAKILGDQVHDASFGSHARARCRSGAASVDNRFRGAQATPRGVDSRDAKCLLCG